MCSSNDTVNQGKDRQNKEEGPTKQEFPGGGERNISATSLEQDWRVTGWGKTGEWRASGGLLSERKKQWIE